MMQGKSTIANLVTGILITLLGVAVTMGAGRLGQGLTYNEPGPGFFPRLIGIGMIICGVVEAFWMLRQRREKGADWGGKRGWGLLLLLAAYVVSWGRVHYLISTGIFLFAVSWFLGSKKWVGNLAVSAALAAVFFTLFSSWLKIPLP
jgi:putative tricarboxylic transport membrane protein